MLVAPPAGYRLLAKGWRPSAGLMPMQKRKQPWSGAVGCWSAHGTAGLFDPYAYALSLRAILCHIGISLSTTMLNQHFVRFC